jgi:hypothetical protein
MEYNEEFGHNTTYKHTPTLTDPHIVYVQIFLCYKSSHHYKTFCWELFYPRINERKKYEQKRRTVGFPGCITNACRRS